MGLSGTFKNRHSNSIGFAIGRDAGGKIRRVRCFLQRIACCLDLYGRLLPRKTAEIRPSFECATKQQNDLMSNWPKISCEFEICKNALDILRCETTQCSGRRPGNPVRIRRVQERKTAALINCSLKPQNAGLKLRA